MKTSKRILLIAGAVIVAVILSLIIASRVFVVNILDSGFPEDGVIVESTSDSTTEVFEVAGFDSLVLTGAWGVDVRMKDEYRVSVSMPAEVSQYLRVEQSGGELRIYMTKPIKLPDNTMVKVVVWTPVLTRITSEGYADLKVSGFHDDRLAFTGNGVMTCHTQNGSFEEISVDFKGIGSFDFQATEVVDANIVIQGIADVDIDMAGGTLSGKIDIGSIKYRGDVERLDVKGGQVAEIARVD